MSPGEAREDQKTKVLKNKRINTTTTCHSSAPSGKTLHSLTVELIIQFHHVRPDDSALMTINNNTITEPKLVLIDHHVADTQAMNSSIDDDSFDKVSLEESF